MRASLDTNVIIHLYRAKLQNVLFEVFMDGVIVYEQIRNIELENHGKEVISDVDADIAMGKIELYTDKKLKEQGVFKIFAYNVKENWMQFVKRFLKDPYKAEEKEWMEKWSADKNVDVMAKLRALSKLV